MNTYQINVRWSDRTKTQEQIECGSQAIPDIVSDYFEDHKIRKVRAQRVEVVDVALKQIVMTRTAPAVA